jgi:hypothetical protein
LQGRYTFQKLLAFAAEKKIFRPSRYLMGS